MTASCIITKRMYYSASSMDKGMTPQQLDSLVNYFLSLTKLGEKSEKPTIVAVTGFPGSGKTTVAKHVTELLGGTHIQANSARQILREAGLMWNTNVTAIIGNVLEKLLSEKRIVVMDWHVLEEGEQKRLEGAANKHGAGLFFIAVDCKIQIALDRDEERPLLPSTFDNWQPSAPYPKEYMCEQARKLYEFVARRDNLYSINNSGTEKTTRSQIADIVGRIKLRM